jgi:hypothetical protein
MNSAIEIHDSSLTSIAKRSDLLELHFDAYIHTSEGTRAWMPERAGRKT